MPKIIKDKTFKMSEMIVSWKCLIKLKFFISKVLQINQAKTQTEIQDPKTERKT